MVGSTDIRDLLTTGTWSTHRTRSPRSSKPIRANQSSKLDAPNAPDGLHSPDPLGKKIPRSFTFVSHRCFPPPPSVEDEEKAVAKEHNASVVNLSDEEPKCRGDVEQLPILLPVSEHNVERRFVLVTPSETDDGFFSESQDAEKPKTPPKTEYAANTKVQLDPEADKSCRPELQKRKSRVDLPRIETDVQPPRPKITHAQRTRSATSINQRPRETRDSRENGENRDYFSHHHHPESARPAAEAYLSPVIKHSTKGRDRAYWNFNRGSNASSPRGSGADSKPNSGDRKGQEGYARSAYVANPMVERRTNSAVELPREARRPAERYNSYRDEMYSRSRRNGPPSPPLDRRQSPPPRSTRKESPPVRSHAEAPRMSRQKSSYHSHPSSPREDDLTDSSDDYRGHKSHQRPHNPRRKSTVIQQDRPSLLGPVGPRPAPISKSKSRPPSPLPSPTTSHSRFPDPESQANPRSSTTFNVARDKRRGEIERPVSPISSGGSSSPRSCSRLMVDDRTLETRPRASSRTPSIRSNASTSKPANTPPAMSNSTTLPGVIPSNDRKRQTMPPSPAYSRQSSLETVPHQNAYWQPEPFFPPQQAFPTPRQSASNLDHPSTPVVSFRRYSEDVNAGTLPGLPDCPRKRPRAGYVDWLTLPRCENFNICPSCYQQVFFPTEFRELFVSAPFRSRDKEIACDLGTSPWYRIAWLMTRKYQRSDLRLLQGIADVFAKNKIPCYGSVKVTRIWYSIIDPETRRCIPDFIVCSPCARAVEVLFPSLMGVFVPLDRTAEPRPGKCGLHFTPNRNRFLTYFDAFESTHDRAVSAQSPPSVHSLADKIKFWSGVEECPRDEPLRHKAWYVMRDIPDMTICPECFLDVVWPELVAEADAAKTAAGAESPVNSVARNLYQKQQLIKSATVCQMASPWVRELFKRACKRVDGIDYLDAKVGER